MIKIQEFFGDALIVAEFIAALTGILYYKKLKNSYWKYFIFFLLLIFIAECLGKWDNLFTNFSKINFYNYIIIPIQFIFYYWLYTLKQFKNKKLFFFISVVYILSFIPTEFLLKKNNVLNSISYTMGCLLLMFLVIKEYYAQVNSKNILEFKENKMFYINLGITLFFIGTLPFFTLYPWIVQYENLWNIYNLYFLISDIIMYLLFAASFIWGKQNS